MKKCCGTSNSRDTMNRVRIIMIFNMLCLPGADAMNASLQIRSYIVSFATPSYVKTVKPGAVLT